MYLDRFDEPRTKQEEEAIKAQIESDIKKAKAGNRKLIVEILEELLP